MTNVRLGRWKRPTLEGGREKGIKKPRGASELVRITLFGRVRVVDSRTTLDLVRKQQVIPYIHIQSLPLGIESVFLPLHRLKRTPLLIPSMPTKRDVRIIESTLHTQ